MAEIEPLSTVDVHCQSDARVPAQATHAPDGKVLFRGSQEKTATRYGRRRSIRHDRMHPTARNTVEQTPARSVCSRPSHHITSHRIASHLA
jgi:hypothetical protein